MQLLPPGVRLRSVVDRGVVYQFPENYSHPLLSKLLHDKKLEVDSFGNPSLVGLLEFLVFLLDAIISEAEELASS